MSESTGREKRTSLWRGPWLGPDLDAPSGLGVRPGVMVSTALGVALLALGLAGLVPPASGIDAVPIVFRLVTVPWLFPGCWLSYRSWAAFRQAWRIAERAGPSPEILFEMFEARDGRSQLDQYGRIDYKRFWFRILSGVSGLLVAVVGALALLFGLIGIWLAMAGTEGPGSLLNSAAAVVAGIWVLVTGWRRYQLRAHPEWSMETKRVTASVRLHRRLETLIVCGVATTWLVVGQLIMVLDLAG